MQRFYVTNLTNKGEKVEFIDLSFPRKNIQGKGQKKKIYKPSTFGPCLK